MFISSHAVAYHLRKGFCKLGIHNRAARRRRCQTGGHHWILMTASARPMAAHGRLGRGREVFAAWQLASATEGSCDPRGNQSRRRARHAAVRRRVVVRRDGNLRVYRKDGDQAKPLVW